MTRRGPRPRRGRWLVGILGALGLLAAACGGNAGGSGTTVTYVGVAGGAISFGMTDSPTGCNPNTPEGDTPGTLTVLGAVLPSPWIVNNAGTLTANLTFAVVGAGEPQARDDRLHPEPQGRVVRRRPDHRDRLRVHLAAPEWSAGGLVARRDQHRRLPRTSHR